MGAQTTSYGHMERRRSLCGDTRCGRQVKRPLVRALGFLLLRSSFTCGHELRRLGRSYGTSSFLLEQNCIKILCFLLALGKYQYCNKIRAYVQQNAAHQYGINFTYENHMKPTQIATTQNKKKVSMQS